MIGSGVKTGTKGIGVKLPQPSESKDELKKLYGSLSCESKPTSNLQGVSKQNVTPIFLFIFVCLNATVYLYMGSERMCIIYASSVALTQS